MQRKIGNKGKKEKDKVKKQQHNVVLPELNFAKMQGNRWLSTTRHNDSMR